MKKALYLFFALFALGATVNAQAPSKINFQGVARDASGSILANSSIGVRFTIKSGSASGTNVYQEVHSATTNQFGLFSLQIGGGSLAPGSGQFSAIDWSSNSFFVETAIDPLGGSNFAVVGTSQLLSVPYALYAKDGGGWHQNNNDLFNTNTNQVGIGITSPTSKLHVVDGSTVATFRKTGTNALAVSEVFQIETDSIYNNNDLLSLEVPSTSPLNAQFIEFERGSTSVAAVNTDGSFNTAAEYRRTSTDDANLVPIAYGYITGSGTISTNLSTNNFTCTKTSTGLYSIVINGVASHNDLVISVTPKNTGVSTPDFVNYGSVTGALRVYTFTYSGGLFTAADDDFSFVVYQK